LRGTHQRDFRGMAPTGKEIEEKGVSVFRLSEEGRVVESWDSYYSQLSLMRHSIEQELRLARSIQQAFLPGEVPAPERCRL
jgi:serine phosphatase RsbU (regulator of sigma subunit)